MSAEAVKLDPGCPWEGHSEGVGAGIGDESTESCRVVRPHCTPLVMVDKGVLKDGWGYPPELDILQKLYYLRIGD